MPPHLGEVAAARWHELLPMLQSVKVMTKELYAFPAKGGGIQPIVSIDGWARIINDHPMFDGMDFEDVREGEEIIAITCRMHRKDRSRSIEATEYMAECRRSTDVWRTWPRRMLRHKAMIQCARYAFGFSGIVEQDEYERQMTAHDVTPREAPNLHARLSAPKQDDSPGEGFTVHHPIEADDQIPDFDAEAPAPAEEVAVAAEITPEVAGEVVSEIAEGYPMVDPLMVEEIVKKHLVSIMEELKAAYTEMGKMKDKMAAFASQMETMTDIVEKVAELPSEAPKPTASAIVEQRKAAAQQNFNALAQAIQTLKKPTPLAVITFLTSSN